MAVTTKDFASSVDSWVRQTEARMTAVFREATQRTVSLAQERIPVDTGYARASIRASLTAMPTIDQTSRPQEGQKYITDNAPVILTIANATLGQTIYIGWTASYVQYLENGSSKQAPSGFVGLAALEWPNIVDRVTEELKSRVRQS
jgi:hypothetical protein